MHDELPDPAQQLWQAHGEMLIAELSELGNNPGTWHLGGGTLLAKEWRHRRSFDLDITISTAVPARQSREVVITIANKLKSRGLEIDDITEDRLVRANAGKVDGFGNEAGIDLWIHESALPDRTTTEPIGNHLVPRLSTAQILNGKLQRDRKGLIRDAYDIAHARRKDSRALEQALNILDPKHQRRAEIVFATRSLKTQEKPTGIIGWSGEPKENQHRCWLEASNAIHDARWVELQIKTENHCVQATTVNTAGRTPSMAWTERRTRQRGHRPAGTNWNPAAPTEPVRPTRMEAEGNPGRGGRLHRVRTDRTDRAHTNGGETRGENSSSKIHRRDPARTAEDYTKNTIPRGARLRPTDRWRHCKAEIDGYQPPTWVDKPERFLNTAVKLTKLKTDTDSASQPSACLRHGRSNHCRDLDGRPGNSRHWTADLLNQHPTTNATPHNRDQLR